MNASFLVQRYRMFLLGLAGFMCIGTIVELILQEHYQEPLQFVPFILCTLAFLTIVLVWFRPSSSTIWSLRLVMGGLMLGALVGIFEHLQGNQEILIETKPNLATLDMIWGTLRGAAPILAPGILVLVALLALAATYYHPTLENQTTA